MPIPFPADVEAAMRRLYDSLSERERRLYSAAEAVKLGHGGLTYLTRLFQCDPKTIRRGILELKQQPSLSPGKSRKKGAADVAV